MAIALIASANQASVNGSSATTGAINTTGANLLAVHVANYGGSGAGTLTDSKGNTWTPGTPQNGGNARSRWYYAAGSITVGSGHTFTITADFAALEVFAFSGADASPFDQESGNLVSGTSFQPGSLTPSDDDCLVVIGVAVTANETIAINGSFSTPVTNAFTPGQNLGGSASYWIQTTATAANPTWTFGNSLEASTTMIVFKAATVPVVYDTIPVDDANWFFSPYNWRLNGSTYAQTNNTGAYFKLGFTGTSLQLSVDVSMLVSASVDSDEYPAILTSIDGGAFERYQLTSADDDIFLATGLSAGTHEALCMFVGAGLNDDRWTTPEMVWRITAALVDDGEASSAPTVYDDSMVVFGDSHGEGFEALAAGNAVANMDASQAYPHLIGRAFQCEVGVIAFAGQGYTVTGAGNVPDLEDAWDFYFDGESRLSGGLFDPEPTYIVSAHGTNDGGSVAAAVEALIAAWRAAAPDATMFFLVPPGAVHESDLAAGVTAADDANAYTTDHEENLLALAWSDSGSHPNVRGQARYAAAQIRLMQGSSAPCTSHVVTAASIIFRNRNYV